MQTPVEAVNYLSCAKAGPHEDEKLNLVCLETSCLENLACCCACIEIEHKKHVTKPLKFVINEARKQSGASKSKMNIDILLDIVATQRKNSFEQFQKHRRDIVASLGNIELALQGYYNSIVQQIIVKNTDGNLLIEEAIERASNAKSLEELKFTLKKLVAAIPNQSQGEHSNLSEADLIASLESSSQDIRRSINLSMEEANKRLSEYQQNILQLINNLKIWNPPRYKFTEEAKHPDIKLVSETTVKAYKNSGYKFAIMEPGVESGKSSKKFAFKIRESSSNWLAIGVCHKKVIQSKAYGFVFGSVGHGAYMISSNGGSWSHLRADQNNTIKAFKFSKGDVVQVTLQTEQKKVVFSLQSQSYELPFEPIASDQLHPCILFYYVNDEIEYLPHYKL